MNDRLAEDELQGVGDRQGRETAKATGSAGRRTIDWITFAVRRHRKPNADRWPSQGRARVMDVLCTGRRRAVVFSLTAAIGLIALEVIPVPFLRSIVMSGMSDSRSLGCCGHNLDPGLLRKCWASG
jgi:hypothetical protein